MTDSKDWQRDTIERYSRDEIGSGWRPEFRPSQANIAIPRAVLEKMYLSPPTNVTGSFRNMMANPTPLGLVGFLVATLPTSCALMGLAGAGGGGAATSGLSMWFGGVLQMIACAMEWFLGNTFSFLVFGTFGAAWFALSSAPQVEQAFVDGLTHSGIDQAVAEAQFRASFAWGLVVFGLLIITFGLCALRTNVVFVACFAIVSNAVFLLAGSYWVMASGRAELAVRMQKAVGAIFLFCCVLAWYLLVANLLEALEFGYSLPVGDLSSRLARHGKQAEFRDRSQSV